jgi:hypothetical protein
LPGQDFLPGSGTTLGPRLNLALLLQGIGPGAGRSGGQAQALGDGLGSQPLLPELDEAGLVGGGYEGSMSGITRGLMRARAAQPHPCPQLARPWQHGMDTNLLV